MANRFYSPNQQFVDATGLPYSGYYLGFYASGTSTPLATYTDSALTIANTNPIQLDSRGAPANSIFLQNLAYKVVLSSDLAQTSPVWTYDPVYSSDYSARAKLLTGSGSPNGTVAGTAGSPGIGADTYWDSTNNILYVCTVTGSSVTAVWTAVNASTAAAVVPPPLGYLTLTSGTPIINADVIATNAVFYTPYLGNTVPVYNGSSFVPLIFSELTLTLSSSQAASTLYDVFVFSNSGVLTLVTGPAWNSSTAGSCSRGTGAGTTQLSRLNGLWVNTVQITGRNAANTFSVPASQGTYLGSIFVDATPGQVTNHVSYGQSRKWGVWNAYNRNRIQLKAGDGTASWTYATATTRAANASSANSFTVFSGLPEENYDLAVTNWISASLASTQQSAAQVGVGFNSITVMSGQIGQISFSNQTTQPVAYSGYVRGNYLVPPSLGINTITALENGLGATSNGFHGTETYMLLSGVWRG